MCFTFWECIGHILVMCWGRIMRAFYKEAILTVIIQIVLAYTFCMSVTSLSSSTPLFRVKEWQDAWWHHIWFENYEQNESPKKNMQGACNSHYLWNLQWKCERKAERKIKTMKTKMWGRDKEKFGSIGYLKAVSYSFRFSVLLISSFVLFCLDVLLIPRNNRTNQPLFSVKCKLRLFAVLSFATQYFVKIIFH